MDARQKYSFSKTIFSGAFLVLRPSSDVNAFPATTVSHKVESLTSVKIEDLAPLLPPAPG